MSYDPWKNQLDPLVGRDHERLEAVLKEVEERGGKTAAVYADLEEREAKIRRLVDANIVGIFIWNFEGEIIEANEAFLQLVGYRRMRHWES